MSSPMRRGPCRSTGARSSTASTRSVTAGSSVRRGSSAGRAGTSCGRCSSSARGRTRCRSSTTSAARRRSSAISRKRRRASSSFRTAHTTWRRRATARGPSSQRRSSRRPASTVESVGSRPRSWVARPRVPRTRSCAASEAHRSSRTGVTASAPVCPSLTDMPGARHPTCLVEACRVPSNSWKAGGWRVRPETCPVPGTGQGR